MPKPKQKDDEEEIVMVGPGAEEGPEDDQDQTDAPEIEEEEEDEKERKNAKAEDGEEDDVEEDARAGHGEDDEEEGEDGKLSSKEARKQRKERQKRAKERSQRELAFLRKRNEDLERQHNDLAGRVTATETTTIDQRISALESQLKVAQNVEAEAIRLQEGEDAVESRTIQDRIRKQIDTLTRTKQEISSRTEDRAPKIDPQLLFHAQTWMEENDWYDPKGSNKDSRTVVRLDRQIVNEGFDPKSPEYWDELTKRAKKALPHRFKNGDDSGRDDDEEERPARNGSGASKKSGGPKFSTGGRERPLRQNEVFVSPERKAAMMEAGVWDDKVLRQRYLKNYQKWDRENKDIRGRDR